jgi:signal transduction histidine kinase
VSRSAADDAAPSRWALGPRTLRGRLALIFGLVTIAVSLLVGGFVLLRYKSGLSSQVTENLETRYDDVRAAVAQAAAPVAGRDLPIIPRAEVFAQVIDDRGEVVAASPKALLDDPVLSKEQIAAASARPRTIEQSVSPRSNDARLLVGTQKVGDQRLVVVVGASLDGMKRSQRQLETDLAIGMPILAIVVIAAGWMLAGAALRPVRSMVSDADAYSAQRRGQRLSVPDGEELAELARRLNAMLNRIEDAIDHEHAFLDDASHELRTPIAIARAELELASMQVRDPAAAEALASALEEVERLDHLATNLLVLARVRAAGPPPGEPVDLAEVADRVVVDVERAHGPAGVELHVTGSASATGDADALERAVTNLVDNAVRYASTRVDVTLTHADGRVAVEVHDDGPGFPRELLDRAVDRFVRGGAGGSAGLGLAIVDAIAVAHGGGLEISNDPDGGAIVRLWIPTPADATLTAFAARSS